MKKNLIIVFTLIPVLCLSGCLEAFLGDRTDDLIGDWDRDGSPDYKIRLNEDGTGVALSRNANDYLFDWRLDPDTDDIMYWEIDGETTRVVYYYLLKEGEILVLEWDGSPSVYEKG